MLKSWISRGTIRTRWGAIGAAVAVAVGGGGILGADAAGTASTSVFTAIAPCRILDTRAAYTVGGRTSPLGPAETYSITTFGTNGNCTLPATFTALSLNVTIVNPTGSSYLTVFPAGGTVPTASNLNFVGGQEAVPNAVTVAVAGDGRISLYNNGGSVDVIVDVVGYFASHDHDDRYYTKPQIDAALGAARSLSTLYSASTYKMSLEGCAVGQVKLIRSKEWGTANALPASFPCVDMPTWASDTELSNMPLSWSALLPAALPAAVRVAPDLTLSLNMPLVNGTVLFFGCQTTPAGGVVLVYCRLLPQGLVTVYPFNSKTAVDAAIAANVESNAVQLSQYTPANP